MLKTYETLKNIIGEKAAKDIIKILVNDFKMYISFDDIQTINIYL